MNAVALPALDGREALGFLAALGTLRLVAAHEEAAARLSFDPATAAARLHSDRLGSVIDVTGVLDRVFTSLGDARVPDMPADFPPPGVAPDPLRVQRAGVAPLVEQWEQTADPSIVRAWLRALVTDLAVEDDGRVSITPYAAPSGKQSFSTMFTKTRDAVRARPEALTEALVGWRRVPGYTGEYLDHRVLESSADSPVGQGAERGVPGATWLALMALPLLPVTGRRAAVGWQTAGGMSVLRWPVWERPLDLAAVTALLRHPALGLETAGRGEFRLRTGARAQLGRLGVFGVAVARRRRVEGRKSAGVLAPSAWLPV